jgi:death-on-curing protein
MNFLTKEDIIVINRKTVKHHGGNFVEPCNFLHEENLDYLVEVVQAEAFGQPLYPSLSDKAALYMHNIICNHIFQDGNKRTGLEAAILFVRMNGNNLKQQLEVINIGHKSVPKIGKTNYEVLYNFTIEVASGELTLEECQAWFAKNIVT